MLADWRAQLASTSSQNVQEFEHFYGSLLPILRPRTNLAQISNASLRASGDFFDDPGSKLPIPAGRADHRALINDREFQNVGGGKVLDRRGHVAPVSNTRTKDREAVGDA